MALCSGQGGLTHDDQARRNELQHQSIRIVSFLIKRDDLWLTRQPELVEALKQIWCNDEYQVSCNKKVSVFKKFCEYRSGIRKSIL